MEIRLGSTWEEGADGKLYVVCPECGGPMSANALLCRGCFKREGGHAAPIYQEANLRGESSDRTTRTLTKESPTRVYHKRQDQKR